MNEDTKESFVIATVFRMGENDEKYGQTWYCKVEELEVPVMFNLMNGTVQEMDKITFETQEIQKFKSGKNQGSEYRRLKKVKVTDANPREHVPSEEPGADQDLEARVKKLEEAVFGSMTPETTPEPKDDTIAEVTDAEIDLDSIPF